MSKLVCENCKSNSVEYEDYCGGTSYYRCKTCGRLGDKTHFTPMTVFHQITASPEVLAEKLVYRYDGNGTWRSFLLYGYEFLTKEEAIAATVERLKEVPQ